MSSGALSRTWSLSVSPVCLISSSDAPVRSLESCTRLSMVQREALLSAYVPPNEIFLSYVFVKLLSEGPKNISSAAI